MPRFVILEHDHPELHWDLMLEAGPVLRTWPLAAPPQPGGASAAPPRRAQAVEAEVGFDPVGVRNAAARHQLPFLEGLTDAVQEFGPSATGRRGGTGRPGRFPPCRGLSVAIHWRVSVTSV